MYRYTTIQINRNCGYKNAKAGGKKRFQIGPKNVKEIFSKMHVEAGKFSQRDKKLCHKKASICV